MLSVKLHLRLLAILLFGQHNILRRRPSDDRSEGYRIDFPTARLAETLHTSKMNLRAAFELLVRYGYIRSFSFSANYGECLFVPPSWMRSLDPKMKALLELDANNQAKVKESKL